MMTPCPVLQAYEDSKIKFRAARRAKNMVNKNNFNTNIKVTALINRNTLAPNTATEALADRPP